MPRLAKTIIPRLKNSIRNKGVLRTAWSVMLGPYRLLRNYQLTRRNYGDVTPHAFDVRYGVETTKRVHLSDLEIESPNWAYAEGYWPTPPEVFEEALSGLDIAFEDYTFIDLGSGKGRVLLMASDYPFRQIIGVEFSKELQQVSEANIARYQSAMQKCKDVQSVCMDFTSFEFPGGPLFVFLYNPSSQAITYQLAENLAGAMKAQARPLWVLYVTPMYDVFTSGKPMRLRQVKAGQHYALYNNFEEQKSA